jgi:hypothetical protein
MRAGEWAAQQCPCEGPQHPGRCHYEQHSPGSTCGRPTRIIHDKRGCLAVCDQHAAWRDKASVLFGHSSRCPLAPLRATGERSGGGPA